MHRNILTTAIAALTFAAPAMADQHGSGDTDDGRGPGGQMFERLDTNNDGKIDRLEIEQAQNERFARLDADGDGRVTQAEFEAGRAAMREERREARQARMFARHDADGDGVLTSDELPGPRMERMLDRLDSNGDGAITREEMTEHRGKMRGPGKGRMMRNNRDDNIDHDGGN